MRTKIASKKPHFKKHPLTVAVQACCYTLLGGLPLANANPTGGQVVGGSGTISQSGTNTTINQTTQNLAVNWQTFNVQSNERVQFVQPNASAIALNRILSNNGSTIAGRIDANGKVILVNPNGIFFTSTASLNVGSLIASGLDINPSDFMNGKYVFNEISGTSGAVINQGLISASLGGNVALIGKQVKNEGLIQANLGTVTLAAGKEAVLTFDNDGLLGVRVTKEILQSELGVDPAVINSGEIQAQGGRVLLTASQSQDIFTRAVNTNGLQSATSLVVNDDGTFTLGGGADVLNSGTINTSTTSPDQNVGRIVLVGENVTSSGTIKADAQSGNGGEIELHARDKTLLTQNGITSARSESGGNGGIVKVLGDKVGLFDQSTVDVSGANGGGQALVGGDYQGKNKNIRNANANIVNPYTSIFSDALESGDAGRVILWSDGSTYFAGKIFARGGAVAGNGGLVEISGKENLAFRGSTDRSAANGNAGMLLLDPRDITVANSSSSADDSTLDVDFGECTGDNCNSSTDDFTISNAAIQNELTRSGGGSVTLQANNDIFFNGAVTSTTSHSLTLQAGRSIEINANISLGGFFRATANDSDALAGRGTGDATFTMAAGTEITTNGGNITISTGAFSGGIGNITLQTLNSSGSSSNRNAGVVSVTNSTGNITVNGLISANGYSPTSGNGGDGGNIVLQATTGDVRVNTHATLNVLMSANGGNGVGAGDEGGSGGGILIIAGNDVAMNEGISTNGGSANGNGGSLEPAGHGGAVRLVAGRDISLAGAISSNGGNAANASGVSGSGAASTTINGTTYSGISLNVGRDLTITANISALAGTASNDASSIGATSAAIAFNGNGGANTFNINNAIALAAASVTVNGNGGIDRLVRGGTSTPSTWTITNVDDGTLVFGTNTINFFNIASLTGGDGQDNFIINNDIGTLSGLISGGGGADTLTISNNTTNSNNRIVQINDTDTSANLTVRQIETITANSSTTTNNTLIGSNTTANVWSIGATNTTNTVSDGSTTTTFSNFANVQGGNHTATGSDQFTVNSVTARTGANSVTNINTGNGTTGVTVNAGANVSGAITTGTGTNTVAIRGATGAIDGTASNGNNTVTIYAGGTVANAINTGSGIDTITVGEALVLAPAATVSSINAGGGADNVTVHAGATVTNDIMTGAGADIISVSGAARSIDAGAGNDQITLASPGVITGVSPTTLVGVAGGGETDTLTVSSLNNTWSLDATGTGGTVTNGASVSFSGVENFSTGGTNGTLDYSNSTVVVVDLNSFSGFSTVIGSNVAQTSTIIGSDSTTNNWYIGQVVGNLDSRNDGTNDGQVTYGPTIGSTSINFINFNRLTGGAAGATNNFYLTDATPSAPALPSNGLFTGIITGGDSSVNQLTARDLASTWSISAVDSTLVYTAGPGPTTTTFNGIQYLVGALNQNDTFNFNVTPTAAVTVDGRGQVANTTGDTVSFAALTGPGQAVSVQLGAAGFNGIENYTGNGTNSTLIGENTANTWTITGANAGSVGGTTFTGFTALTGALNQNDTFNFNVTPAVANVSVDGRGQAANTAGDTASFATVTGAVNVQLGTGGLSNIEQITGNNTASTLIGADIGNTWTIIGANTGSVGGTTFIGFNSLVGAQNQNDTFNFNVTPTAAAVTVDGRGQANTTGDTVSFAALTGQAVSVQLGAAGFNGIERYTGNSTDSTLIGADIANTWTITGANAGSVGGTTFTGFTALVGALNQNDTFNFNVTPTAANVTLDGRGHVANTTGDTVSFATVTGAVNVQLGTGGFSNIEQITGNNTASTLTGADIANTWTITGTRAGTVGGTNFINFTALVGALNQNDTFNFNVTPTAANVTIDGRGHVANTTGDTVSFATVTGTVNVQLGAGGFSNIEQFTGNGANSTLTGDSSPGTWEVTGQNTGTVNSVQFFNFNNLVGGSGVDTFAVNASINSINTGDGVTNLVTVGATGTVNANITGGTGNDTFIVRGTVSGDLLGGAGDDYFDVIGGVVQGWIYGGTNPIAGGDTVAVGANQSVTIGSVSLSGFRLGDDIEGVTSTNGTLNARENANTTWTVTEVNSGRATDTSGVNMRFTGFSNLIGSAGEDTFNISGNGSITGQINGGNGVNILNVALTVNKPSGQVYYIGGLGSDTVEVTGASNTIVFSREVSSNRLAYTGTTANTFNVNYTYGNVESVTDRVGANTIAINGTNAGSDSITLGHNGTNATFNVNNTGTVAFTSNKNSLIVDGGLLSTGQVGVSDSIIITGNFSTATNDVTLRNASAISQASTAGNLAARELLLDRITNLATPINTAVTSLSVRNSGSVSVNQTGNLALNDINATSPFTVVASGNITDTNTAQRNISGPLTLTSTGGNILLDEANFNFLTGPISLNGATVNIDNSAATNLGSVTATTALSVTSDGGITQQATGAIIAPMATFTAPGQNVTLNNVGNDFNNLIITADAVSVTDLSVGNNPITGAPIPSIASGLITANSVDLTTANGIGGRNVFDTGINNRTVYIPNGNFSTSTSILKINNSAGGVYVTNNIAATVSITNVGDVGIINSGNLTVDRLYTNGNSFNDVAGSKVYVSVSNGKILAYPGSPAYPGLTALPAVSEPNIVAAEIYMRADLGAGLPGRPDVPGGPISVSASDSLIYIFGATSYVYYFREPPFIFGTGDLVASTAFDYLANVQLLEVESLDEFDPAIFTEVRNYYYEDVAIMMPADQRLDSSDDDEKDEEKEGKL